MKYSTVSIALLLNYSQAIMVNRNKSVAGYDVSEGTADLLKETREVLSNEYTRVNAGQEEGRNEAKMIMDRLEKKQNAGTDPKNIAEYKKELDKESDKEDEREKNLQGMKDAVEKKEKMMVERQKSSSGRLIKAE